MKLSIINKTKVEVKKKDLPNQFSERVRDDLIKRAVLAIQNNTRQPYGADPDAGMKQIGKISRRRNNYKAAYGHGIGRCPRKIMTRRGTRFNWVGAVAPGTVAGRRAHPPKAEKKWDQKINKKERRKAIRSAIAATVIKDIVTHRGHKVPDTYPFILDNSFETLSKTKDVKDILIKLGFKEEFNRVEVKKVRAGRGKMRNRKYKRKIGPLFVVSKDCPFIKAAQNLPGVDILEVQNLNAEQLAPGTDFGRATLFTEAAIDRLEKEKLFM